jgi:hypothetical protein
VQRSKKYSLLSDEEILELYISGVKPGDKHYLNLELVERGLFDKAERQKVEANRKSLFSSKKFIFTVVALGILIIRYLERYL